MQLKKLSKNDCVFVRLLDQEKLEMRLFHQLSLIIISYLTLTKKCTHLKYKDKNVYFLQRKFVKEIEVPELVK